MKIAPPRTSRVLDRMRAGKKALCFKSNITSPRIADIVGLCGFDALWICQEHMPTDFRDLESVVYAAKSHDLDTEWMAPHISCLPTRLMKSLGMG